MSEFNLTVISNYSNSELNNVQFTPLLSSKSSEVTFHVSKMRAPSRNLSDMSKKMVEHTKVYDLYELSRFEKLCNIFRSFNPFRVINGIFNAHTILAGSSKKWCPNRILSGKHPLLNAAGAEHIQITSKTGHIVDAHYLDAEQFISNLERLGGSRKLFRLNLPEDSIYNTKPVTLKMENNFPIDMEEVNITNQDEDTIKKFSYKLYYFNKNLVKDHVTGKYYAVPRSSMTSLSQSSYCVGKGSITYGGFQFENKSENHLAEKGLSSTFPGFQFPKNSSNWESAKEILENMGVDKSNWAIYETNKMLYLVRAKDQPKLQLLFHKNSICNEGITLEELRVLPKDTVNDERGTVLLTTNQTDIYEQYIPEMLTFALEGMNILAYNNPGKGLSTGPADQDNINASIEASYQFIRQVKGTPDEKILAKGQCFGGAPTAWLGKEHKKINLMLDQNPANFQDVGIDDIQQLANKIDVQGKNAQTGSLKNRISSWLADLLRTSRLIHLVVSNLLSGYNISEYLVKNEGHKLINIDVPDSEGEGGDHLVPKHHPTLMLDAIEKTKDKEVRLSMNPGATHVTNWWDGEESRDAVIDFLDKTGLSKSFFQVSEEASGLNIQHGSPEST